MAASVDIGCTYLISDVLETEGNYRSGVRTRHLMVI